MPSEANGVLEVQAQRNCLITSLNLRTIAKGASLDGVAQLPGTNTIKETQSVHPQLTELSQHWQCTFPSSFHCCD